LSCSPCSLAIWIKSEDLLFLPTPSPSSNKDSVGSWTNEQIFQGTILVGVHERNVSPQNHFQDIILNDHYVYQFIYFGELIISLDTHIICDWNGCDCLWFGWFKHVLQCPRTHFKNIVPLRSFIEKEWTRITIFVQIDSYVNHK
jgi:hypothetical protein